MNDNLNRPFTLQQLYDCYAGALLRACYSFTHNHAIAEKALINTFVHLVDEASTGKEKYSFARLYKQARKECLLLLDKEPADSYSLLSPIERVVTEMICTRGYSISATAKLLNRSKEETAAILDSISQQLKNKGLVV